MHLVAGATGSLGTEICRRLRALGHPVRALVRTTSDPSRVKALRELGVALVEGDLRDPASLEHACDGVSTVISTVTSIISRQPGDSFVATDEQGQANLIDAAASAGLDRFVYISFSGNISGDDGMTLAKRNTERKLLESGIPCTILKPTVFMEVWLSPHAGFDFPNSRAVVFGTGESPISWISAADVAEFAVLASTTEDRESVSMDLGGPEPLSVKEVVGIFEQLGGQRFSLEHVPEEALRRQSESAEHEVQKTFATLQLSCTRGDAIPMDDQLERFPVKLTSVQSYAARVLQRPAG